MGDLGLPTSVRRGWRRLPAAGERVSSGAAEDDGTVPPRRPERGNSDEIDALAVARASRMARTGFWRRPWTCGRCLQCVGCNAARNAHKGLGLAWRSRTLSGCVLKYTAV